MPSPTESAPLLVLGTPLLVSQVYVFTNFLKSVRTFKSDNGNAAITQLAAWIAPIAALFVFKGSQFGDSIAVTDTLLLSQLDAWTVVLAGVLLGSGASTLFDATKIFDNANSAIKSPLIPHSKP